MGLSFCEKFAQLCPEHWAQAEAFAAGRTRVLPDMMHLEIHPIPPRCCYNNCEYCVGQFTRHLPDVGILTEDIMTAAAKDAIRLGAQMIVVSSNAGEPFLAPGVPGLLRFLKQETAVRLGLHTCGRDLDQVVDALTDPNGGPSYLSVGLDAVNEEVHQAIKRPRPEYGDGAQACRTVKQNIRMLCQLKSEKKAGPYVSLSCQLTTANAREDQLPALRELLDFAFETTGIDEVRFAVPLVPTNCPSAADRERFVRRVCLSVEALHRANQYILDATAELRRLHPDRHVAVKQPAHHPDSRIICRTYRHCANQLLFCVLGPDSWIYPCSTVTAARPERRLLKFEREGDLEEFWHSPLRRRQLGFDVGTECGEFNCTRCEHELNSYLNLTVAVPRKAVGEPSPACASSLG